MNMCTYLICVYEDMYSYMHAYGKKKTYVRIGFQNTTKELQSRSKHQYLLYACTGVYSNDADTECISARHPPSSHDQVFGGTVPHCGSLIQRGPAHRCCPPGRAPPTVRAARAVCTFGQFQARKPVRARPWRAEEMRYTRRQPLDH